MTEEFQKEKQAKLASVSDAGTEPANFPSIVIQSSDAPRRRRNWLARLLLMALLASLVVNVALYWSYKEYFSIVSSPTEHFHSGERDAEAKIAVLKVTGTIMPPFTKRILSTIERAQDDPQVKGVVLSIDSPGGLVADSHQIYHRLSQLREKKPIYVSMKRMAASGGYYVAMGAGKEGKIYAEPTTWTGSIGVIIPRYDVRKLAEKLGVTADPLKTGQFKDSLSPFRELTDEERALWQGILDDSFQRFLNVIADNRADLDYKKVKQLATGRIFTAQQAKSAECGLIDEIGYEEDAIDALKGKLKNEQGIKKFRVVTYRFQPSLLELLTWTVEAKQPENEWQTILEATVPKAMYFCSWAPDIAIYSTFRRE